MRTDPILRGMRAALIPALVLGLGLAACNDDDDKRRSQTVGAVARSEIAQSTTESSEPILVNDLMLSERDTTETGAPDDL